MCKEKFRDKFIKDKKYRKCHYTGDYRGATHSICHLN